MTHSQIEYSDPICLATTPLVSVVMPTYNHERYLAEAIEGVLFQKTSFSIELIVGEDCSTDDTRAIALKYQRKFPEIIRVIVSEKNVGMHENDARLCAAARGTYIAFCEGDDCWHRPDKLSDQIAILETNPDVSLVCSNWRAISDEGTVIATDVLRLDKKSMHSMGLDDILHGRVKTLTVCARASSVQRAIRDSPLCRSGKYPFGDAPLWVELSQEGICRCLPTEYASYRLSTNSATRPRDIMDVYRFIAGSSEFDRDVLALYPLPQGEKAAVSARVHATRRRLRALALLGEVSKARDELQWLIRLGAKLRTRDYLFYLISLFAQPGTIGASSLKWALVRWHTMQHRRYMRVCSTYTP